MSDSFGITSDWAIYLYVRLTSAVNHQDNRSAIENVFADTRAFLVPNKSGGIILPLAMSLTAGTKLGQYEIRATLGAGGMGEVYRAHDTRLDREVAIKVLPESLTSDPDRLRRFEQEARAAAALNHPNILAVYQMATHEGVSYMVSELLDGETLRERLRRGPIPCARRLITPCRSRTAWRQRTTRASSIAT